jgi:hypothetical protein
MVNAVRNKTVGHRPTFLLPFSMVFFMVFFTVFFWWREHGFVSGLPTVIGVTVTGRAQ